ncbi:conserved hypothetical protein [Trichinella spiralis]|uniref:hypothetical protein n=1 Tax=Trichinella spiralis TaxID=6334 RepID=UPI0001EFD8EB|nr:conserved hypothetical protein [Trichinella spiralis]
MRLKVSSGDTILRLRLMNSRAVRIASHSSSACRKWFCSPTSAISGHIMIAIMGRFSGKELLLQKSDYNISFVDNRCGTNRLFADVDQKKINPHTNGAQMLTSKNANVHCKVKLKQL